MSDLSGQVATKADGDVVDGAEVSCLEVEI
jgi:hypothetical protein